jgi:hypothetical protein
MQGVLTPVGDMYWLHRTVSTVLADHISAWIACTPCCCSHRMHQSVHWCVSDCCSSKLPCMGLPGFDFLGRPGCTCVCWCRTHIL